ncbi:MAG: hypothetical protein JWN41_384 [Thermoleophilia bacterium]|nr:hypothetical protein [Thermoleophilia bacterium]
MDDARAIPPIDLDHVEPAPAVPAGPRVAAAGAAGPGVARPATAPPPVDSLGTAAERMQLSRGAAVEPGDVELRAIVHDAAEHGNPIAAAIERAADTQHDAETDRLARRPSAADVDRNAQMLGGAAAAAHSGEAAVVRRDVRTAEPDDLAAPRRLDIVTRVDAGSDDEQRRRRDRQSRRILDDDGDDDPDTGGGPMVT